MLLEVVVHAFRNGTTPEEIVASYDRLELADVDVVLDSYLRQPDTIEVRGPALDGAPVCPSGS